MQQLFFIGETADLGREYYVGGDGVVTLLGDLNPGAESGDYDTLAVDYNATAQLGPLLFFTADGGDGIGPEPYVTDGTPAGTRLLADIVPVDSSGSLPNGYTQSGAQMFFTAFTPETGRELWVSNGTTAGTRLVADIDGTSGNSLVNGAGTLVAARGGVYFAADDGVAGRELWFSDGTAEGTYRVENLDGDFSGTVIGLAQGGLLDDGKLVFTANFSEVWITDGTALGTRFLAETSDSSNGPRMGTFFSDGDRVFFSASNGTQGYNPWVSDGTADGTYQIADIDPDRGSAPTDFQRAGDQIVFRAQAGEAGFFALFATSGAEGDVTRLTASDGTPLTRVERLVDLGDTFVFRADDASTDVLDRATYISDGTSAGTRELDDEDAPYTSFNLAVGEGKAYFSGGSFGEGEARSVTPAGTEVEFSRPGQGFPNRGTFDFLTVYDDAPPASQTPAPFDGSGAADVFDGTEAADIARGFGGADALSGAAGNDTLEGGAGRDTLEGGPGFDRLAGGAEIDTARFGGASSDHALSVSPDAITVVDVTGAGGIDRLYGVERLEFGDGFSFGADGAVDLRAVTGVADLTEAELRELAEVYIAYFDRAPDALGLYFYGNAISNGTSLEQAASTFINSTEYLTTYPDGTTNAEFVESVYNNVIGRGSDQAGFDFWVPVLDDETNGIGRDTFIYEFLQGVQSDSSDEAYLDSKVDLGLYFAAVNGMSNVDNADAAMQLYDGSQSSIDTAVAAIDGFYTDAMHAETSEFLLQLVGVVDNPFAV
jgi:ELWxxDGT repeat protein